jgi:hypothetical protein
MNIKDSIIGDTKHNAPTRASVGTTMRSTARIPFTLIEGIENWEEAQ